MLERLAISPCGTSHPLTLTGHQLVGVIATSSPGKVAVELVILLPCTFVQCTALINHPAF